jgi:putative Ca2+/H+ antiporter (TMEM165/GDT1 family)
MGVVVGVIVGVVVGVVVCVDVGVVVGVVVESNQQYLHYLHHQVSIVICQMTYRSPQT